MRFWSGKADNNNLPIISVFLYLVKLNNLPSNTNVNNTYVDVLGRYTKVKDGSDSAWRGATSNFQDPTDENRCMLRARLDCLTKSSDISHLTKC